MFYFKSTLKILKDMKYVWEEYKTASYYGHDYHAALASQGL